ncbi:MAG: hypothetical protein IT392_02165 [Nitrospirae bacterium]|nr:hypothetical protein [Nitrospirota bacterium]
MKKDNTLDPVDLKTLNLLNLQQEDVEQEGIDPKVKLMDKPFNPALINIDKKTPSLHH